MDTLLEFRRELNDLDDELIRLLSKRYQICRAVAEHKRAQQIPMMQPARVAEVKERCSRLGATHGLDPEFVRQLYDVIIDEACRLEDEIIKEAGRHALPVS